MKKAGYTIKELQDYGLVKRGNDNVLTEEEEGDEFFEASIITLWRTIHDTQRGFCEKTKDSYSFEGDEKEVIKQQITEADLGFSYKDLYYAGFEGYSVDDVVKKFCEGTKIFQNLKAMALADNNITKKDGKAMTEDQANKKMYGYSARELLTSKEALKHLKKNEKFSSYLTDLSKLTLRGLLSIFSAT